MIFRKFPRFNDEPFGSYSVGWKTTCGPVLGTTVTIGIPSITEETSEVGCCLIIRENNWRSSWSLQCDSIVQKRKLNMVSPPSTTLETGREV